MGCIQVNVNIDQAKRLLAGSGVAGIKINAAQGQLVGGLFQHATVNGQGLFVAGGGWANRVYSQ